MNVVKSIESLAPNIDDVDGSQRQHQLEEESSSDDEANVILNQVVDSIQSGKKNINSTFDEEHYLLLKDEGKNKMWAEQKAKRLERVKIKEKIKSGWLVRQALLGNEDGCPNEWYLEKVRCGNHMLVDALFKTSYANPSLNFDINVCNVFEKSALRIAIENEDVDMCKILLKHKVEIRDNLYHAIQQNFVEGVTIILKYEPSITSRIIGENFFFPTGISPFCFAAWQNNYTMLKVLSENGHTLQISTDWWEGIMYAWESGNNRKWYYEAKASPAYMTLVQETYRTDPLKDCMQTITELRAQARLEPMYHQRYMELEEQVEDYMCHLIDEVRSSEELSHLFEYNFVPVKDTKDAIRMATNHPLVHYHQSTMVNVLDQACEHRLDKFVTHQNSQLAIDYLKYRYTPFLHTRYPIRDYILKMLVGCLFPFLCIFYIVDSRSRLGSWITFPTVSFFCHMVSDLTFIALLIANLNYAEDDSEVYSGMAPNVLEIIITIWILGKWLQEFQELSKRGFKSYFNDMWNYNDIMYILLFTAAITFRSVP